MATASLHPTERPSIVCGSSYRHVTVVTPDRCISHLLDGLPAILGTYALVEWMEIAAYLCIRDALGAMELSVAESIDVAHGAAVGVGSTVVCVATVVGVEGRRVTFEVTAEVAGRRVGRCRHVRAIVPRGVLDRAAARATSAVSAG